MVVPLRSRVSCHFVGHLYGFVAYWNPPTSLSSLTLQLYQSTITVVHEVFWSPGAQALDGGAEVADHPDIKDSVLPRTGLACSRWS